MTIEPDAERLLKEATRRTGQSFKAVVNDALRLGLGMRSKPQRPPRFKVETHAFGIKPGVDADRLNQLVGQLEAEETAKRLAR